MHDTEFAYKEEAIPLVSLDPKSNKFIINDDAISFLNSIKGTIGVVGVAGMYRTGKSYLLNRMLLDRSTGFGVGPSINPCTKGIWIWGTPIKGCTPEGDPINVLVIDSEGIGALDEDSTHDSRIFSLAVLLSSCFLYNSTGSIDENAIQNLSLIVNLTKNIHLKSNIGNGEEPDSEDYAKYFPGFVWVVRDFTLQLVDSEGEPISAKEYLEKALAPQKGFSDGIEQKNRIRRLLTSFFKERECFTLVRPLTNEENLQNLELMDIDQLRPEFSSQIINLRRFILNRIRPKTMNHKPLNGSMYSELIQAYIEAINEGAVPNIENAWSYVCKNECMKAMAEGMDIYDALARDITNNKLPLNNEDLKNYHVSGKEKAISLFKKKAIGESSDEFLRELLKKIKNKFANLKLENESEFNRISTTFINREYCAIERKLKNNDYKTFGDFERELKLFQSFFIESGPNGPNKKLFIIDFIQKALNDGANVFIKNLHQELALQRMISQDMQKKLEQEINDLKNDNSKEKQFLLSKVSQLEYERSELEIRENNLKETLNQIKEDKEKFEKELRSEWQAEKEANQKLIEELKSKLLQTEESFKETERKIYLNNSEHEKQQALLQQKIQYYEKSLEELSKKEKDLSVEIKNSKKDHFTQIRENSAKYENLNKTLHAKVDQLEERISELDEELNTRTQKYETDKRKWEETEQNLIKNFEEAQITINSLQQDLAETKNKEVQNIDEYKEQVEMASRDMAERIKILEQNVKQKDEIYKTAKGSFEKEKAVMYQKIEFLELQLNESKNQNSEIKRAYEATLQCFEGAYKTGSGDEVKQIEELKESHRKEIKQLEIEFENIRKRLNQQIEQLTEKNNELELNAQFGASDLKKEIENLRDELDQAEQQRKTLMEQNKSLESQKAKLLKDADDRSTQIIKKLEYELEEQKAKMEQELQEINIKNEESLSQLRNFYEIEKERLERRITEEKDKTEKKLANQSEEYETRIKEDQALHEEELDNLKDELREVEMHNSSITQQYEHELMLKQQTIETLEKYLKESKENFAMIQSTTSSSLETHLNNFANERSQLISKIEGLNQEVSKKDREIFALSQTKEHLEVNSMKKEAMLERTRKELTDEKNALNDVLENTKTKLQKVNDEFLERKVEFNRELALSQQQNEFLNKKIEELQRQGEEVMKRYEEKLKIQKEEHQQELADRIEKLSEEKASIQHSLDKAKKTLKDIESTYNKQLSQLGKEKALVQEKLQALETKMGENDQRLLSDNQNYLSQISQLKDNFVTEKKLLMGEVDKYKNQYLQLEQDHSEVVSNYERDKALWKGKFHFLEQQREQAKNDLADAQKKFELTLAQLQKYRKADKEENENTQNALIASIEKRYQGQIQELVEAHQQRNQELEEKCKKLEKDLKNANDKMLVENYGKLGNQTFIEKKINEMAENEKRLQSELESVKGDRDSKTLEYQRLLDKEREIFKAKLTEIEQKFRESESKRSTFVFEHEKQRAKWNLEKDHLLNQKNDLQETIGKLEKKREILLRENEKLKNETKVTRRSVVLGGGGFMSSGLLNQKSTNTASKMKPASPGDSRGSTRSIEKTGIEISNGSKQYDASGASYFGFKSGSTVITSDDES